jgi:hypothetical protein
MKTGYSSMLPRTLAYCKKCGIGKHPTDGYLRLLKASNLPYVCKSCLAAAPAPAMNLGKLGAM